MLLNKTIKAILLCGITVTLCACATTDNSGASAKTLPASDNRANERDIALVAEAGLTSRQRMLKSIQQLEVGNADVASVELNEYLTSTPDSSRARHLLKQINTPANEFYPAEFFIVELAFGQSISTLAQHYLGNALEFYALAKYNGIENPSRINTGSKIKIPLTANAKSVREKDAQSAQKKQQGTELQPAAVTTDSVESKGEPQIAAEEDKASEVPLTDAPESPATLKAKLADANSAGDFAKSVSLLELLTSQNAEFDASTRVLASEALVGRANMIKADQASTAAQLYTQAADFMQQNGNEVSAFDYFKLAYATDDSNSDAQQKMTQLQQQISNKYHREASILFRQQRIDEAIKKWDVVLHVDPSNTDVSAYRSQAVELQQRLKALNP